jgi:hypothetical protein
MHDVQKDHHTNSNAGGETGNINKGEDLAFHQVSPGYLEIVLDHGAMKHQAHAGK